MSRTITGVKIIWSEKKNAYIITTSHKDGAWEGETTGAKIYKVDGFLVETKWGSGEPIAVYKDEKQMATAFRLRYKVEPEILPF